MKKRLILIVSLGLICAILSFLWYERAHSPVTANGSVIPVVLRSPKGEEVRLQVEIADEPEERRTGLMGRTMVKDGHGMLFLFDEEATLSFWMKDTLVPLDILYFDGRGAFVSRATMVPCGNQDPCPAYPSDGPAAYALEVKEGEVLTKDIGESWVLEYMNTKFDQF